MSTTTRTDSAPNFYTADGNLRALLCRLDPDLLQAEEQRLVDFGAWAAQVVDPQAAYTSRYAPPMLETYDADGTVVNRVRHNPLYREVHREAYRRGIVGLNHGEGARPFLLTFAMGYLLAQADISLYCPVTLTAAVAQVLKHRDPSGRLGPYLDDLVRMDGQAKSGGTWATERQGGSDLGANTTEARPAPDGGFYLHGLKWFASNVDCDLALVTARPIGAQPGSKGLGLYLLPRELPDGTPNRYRIRRLKDKVGTRGLATGEVELEGAWALEVAPPPKGLACMMEALGLSRIHNALAAAGMQRRAFAEALDHAGDRSAFGRRLLDQPMIQDTLRDLQARLEAGTALSFEAAVAFAADQGASQQTRGDDTWCRLVTALAKYLTAEQVVAAARDAMELLGGNGYVEDYVTARLYRDAEVMPIWEGPANIQALEVCRLLPAPADGFARFAERIDGVLAGAAAQAEAVAIAAPIEEASRQCRKIALQLREDAEAVPRLARRLLELMAECLAAALLLEEALAALPGNARKLMVAQRYVATCLLPRLARVEPLARLSDDQVLRLLRAEPLTPGEYG